MTDKFQEHLYAFMDGYCTNVADGMKHRWEQITPEIYQKEKHEVVGGLMSRQAVLACDFMRNPGIWNVHSSSLILRGMIDCHILLAWIMCDLEARANQYVHYGFGQAKLLVEKFKITIKEENNISDDMAHKVTEMENWLNSQIAEWAIDINVGSAFGISMRKMAEEAGCKELYDHMFTLLSGSSHNIWYQVSMHNMAVCQNPLHKNHRIPIIPKISIHPYCAYLSAKYVSMSYELIDEKLMLKCNTPLPLDYFNQHFSAPSSEKDSQE